MTTLYVETNLLVGVATGRVPDLDRLLSHVGNGFGIAIPGVCFFESLSWMEGEGKRRTQFDRLLDEQIGQLKRDQVSGLARSLYASLSKARAENRDLLKSINSRLFRAIEDVSRVATVIGIDASILDRCRSLPLIDELTDNLILHSILGHALAFPGEEKLFLSGNTADFGGVDVRRTLREAGIPEYFTETEKLLGWLAARPGS